MAPTLTDLPTHPVIAGVLFFVVALLARYVYIGLSTRARRQKMISENGCRPPVKYQHKGILGKLLGLDNIKASMTAASIGRMNEHDRVRHFSGHNTISIRVLDKTVIITTEPENVKTILASKFDDFCLGKRRIDSFVPVFGHGIFDTNGPEWQRSRAMIRPSFTRQQVADLDTFETHVQHLINNIPRDGSTFDLQQLFFSLTMDSATEFLFGKSTNTLDPAHEMKSAKAFVTAFTHLSDEITRDFSSGGINTWYRNKKYRSSVKTINSFADELVNDAIIAHNSGRHEKMDSSSEKERYVFLYELLNRTQDPYTLRSELLNVLLAGRDTTAGLLSNTWHVLARRPDIWKKLRQEVDALEGRRPTYADIKDMRYLKYVLNESLRLMPVVPGNARTAVRDTVLPLGGGEDGKSPVFVKAGQVVGYSVWSMHRREDFYGADALEFKPERWESLRVGWEYLPFNGGPRVCIGQQFALLEASYATVRLMQKFQTVEKGDDEPWKEMIQITLASGTGCWVSLKE